MAIVKRHRWVYFILFGVIFWGAMTSSRCRRETPHPYTVGLVTWVGYGPIYIAQEKHFFRDAGLDLIVRILDDPGAREAAYQADQLDFFPNTPDAFTIFFSSQQPHGKIVAALDESQGADGVVAKKEVATIADLRGKRVGFQKGITSHFLLLYLLNNAGLTGADVQQVDLSAGDAGAAFAAGRLDAAVTWEPWLTVARKSPDSRVLATSLDAPGLIVDCVLASDRAMGNNGDAVKRFMSAWFRAVEFMKTNPGESQAIIARNFKMPPAQVGEMLTTTKFLSREQSITYLQRDLSGVFNNATRLYLSNHVIRKPPQVSNVIDTTPLKAIK
ncbi:MAG TPA: ABC transporter substrate-binding protein [Thermoanaerobaculia bacterium]|jgi:NitT/TauT family transport system substrate-binding protein|nr:ABC transporter substrate-binding protein [Thermoanaerobaculia bacterium]